jgi:hypothetical protein
MRGATSHSMSNQHGSQPDRLRIELFFCEIVVPMEISIPAKFYCFMATKFFRSDIQSCKKKLVFLATSCLRKSGITSASIEKQSSLTLCSFQS